MNLRLKILKILIFHLILHIVFISSTFGIFFKVDQFQNTISEFIREILETFQEEKK